MLLYEGFEVLDRCAMGIFNTYFGVLKGGTMCNMYWIIVFGRAL